MTENDLRSASLLTDTHCHLNHADYDSDRSEVIGRAQKAGVTRAVCVGYDLESSARSVELARDIPMVSASVGVHPHDARTFDSDTAQRIRALASERPYVLAIGETGLDYYRDLSPRDVQQKVYREHIHMATELDLPLIIHSRDSQEDVLGILEEEGVPSHGVVMHCLPSDPDFARGAVALGCYVGIAGPVTFKNADHLREIVASLPLDRILLETDAPYLAPHPHRGQRNEPSYIPLIESAVADLKGVSTAVVAEITSANASSLFQFEP